MSFEGWFGAWKRRDDGVLVEEEPEQALAIVPFAPREVPAPSESQRALSPFALEYHPQRYAPEPDAYPAPPPSPSPRVAPQPDASPPPESVVPEPKYKLEAVATIPWALDLAPRNEAGEFKESGKAFFTRALHRIDWMHINLPGAREPTDDEDSWMKNTLRAHPGLLVDTVLERVATNMYRYTSAKAREAKAGQAAPFSSPATAPTPAPAPAPTPLKPLTAVEKFKLERQRKAMEADETNDDKPAPTPASAPTPAQGGPPPPDMAAKLAKLRVDKKWQDAVDNLAAGGQSYTMEAIVELFAQIGLPQKLGVETYDRSGAIRWARDRFNAKQKQMGLQTAGASKADAATAGPKAKRRRAYVYDEKSWNDIRSKVFSLQAAAEERNGELDKDESEPLVLDESRIYDPANPQNYEEPDLPLDEAVSNSVAYMKMYVNSHFQDGRGDEGTHPAIVLSDELKADFGAKRALEEPTEEPSMEDVKARLICLIVSEKEKAKKPLTDAQKALLDSKPVDVVGLSYLFLAVSKVFPAASKLTAHKLVLGKGETIEAVLKRWATDDSVFSYLVDHVYQNVWTRECDPSAPVLPAKKPKVVKPKVVRTKPPLATAANLKVWNETNLVADTADYVLVRNGDLPEMMTPEFSTLQELQAVVAPTTAVRDAIKMLQNGGNVTLGLPEPFWWFERHPFVRDALRDEASKKGKGKHRELPETPTWGIEKEGYDGQIETATLTGFDPNTNLFRAHIHPDSNGVGYTGGSVDKDTPLDIMLDLSHTAAAERARLEAAFDELDASDDPNVACLVTDTTNPTLAAYLAWAMKALRSPLVTFSVDMSTITEFALHVPEVLPDNFLGRDDEELYNTARNAFYKYREIFDQKVVKIYQHDLGLGMRAIKRLCLADSVQTMLMSNLIKVNEAYVHFERPPSGPTPAPRITEPTENVRKFLRIYRPEDIHPPSAKSKRLTDAASDLEAAYDAVQEASASFTEAEDFLKDGALEHLKLAIKTLGDKISAERSNNFDAAEEQMRDIPESKDEVDADADAEAEDSGSEFEGAAPDDSDDSGPDEEEESADEEEGSPAEEQAAPAEEEAADDKAADTKRAHQMKAAKMELEDLLGGAKSDNDEEMEDDDEDGAAGEEHDEGEEEDEEDEHEAFGARNPYNDVSAAAWEARVMDGERVDAAILQEAYDWLLVNLKIIYPGDWRDPRFQPFTWDTTINPPEKVYLEAEVFSLSVHFDNLREVEDYFFGFADLYKRAVFILGLADDHPTSNEWAVPKYQAPGIDAGKSSKRSWPPDGKPLATICELLAELERALNRSIKGYAGIGRLVSDLPKLWKNSKRGTGAISTKKKPKKGETWFEWVEENDKKRYKPKRKAGVLLPRQPRPPPPPLAPEVAEKQFPRHQVVYEALDEDNGTVMLKRNELYVHQLMNIERYKRQVGLNQGLLVCDEPGLGKSASAVACAMQFNNVPERTDFSVLIVCVLANIQDPWVNTIKQWTTYPDRYINVFDSNSRHTDKNIDQMSDSTWTVIGYDKLRSIIMAEDPEKEDEAEEAEEAEEGEDDGGKPKKAGKSRKPATPEELARRDKFLAHAFDCVVFDELHTVINPATVKFKALRRLVEEMRKKKTPNFGLIGLTGTPMVNSRADLAIMARHMDAPTELQGVPGSKDETQRPGYWWTKAKFADPNLVRAPVLTVSWSVGGVQRSESWQDRIAFMTRTTTDGLKVIAPGLVAPLYVYKDEFEITESEKARFKALLQSAYEWAELAEPDDTTGAKKKPTAFDVLARLLPMRLATTAESLSVTREEAPQYFSRFIGQKFAQQDVTAESLAHLSEPIPAGTSKKVKDTLLQNRQALHDALRTRLTELESVVKTSAKFEKLFQVAKAMVLDTYDGGTRLNPPEATRDALSGWGDLGVATSVTKGKEGVWSATPPGTQRKILIFGEFNFSLDAIAHHLLTRFKEVEGFHDMQLPEVYSGEMPHHKRHLILANFKRAPASKRPILLLNLNSASVGLNLQFASGVIFTEMSWGPVKHTQALARAWRIGQHRDVRVSFLYPVASGNPKSKEPTEPLNTMESMMFKTKVLAKRDTANTMYKYLDPMYTPKNVDKLDFSTTQEVETGDAYKMMLTLRKEYFVEFLTPAEKRREERSRAKFKALEMDMARKRGVLEKRDKDAMEAARANL